MQMRGSARRHINLPRRTHRNGGRGEKKRHTSETRQTRVEAAGRGRVGGRGLATQRRGFSSLDERRRAEGVLLPFAFDQRRIYGPFPPVAPKSDPGPRTLPLRAGEGRKFPHRRRRRHVLSGKVPEGQLPLVSPPSPWVKL